MSLYPRVTPLGHPSWNPEENSQISKQCTFQVESGGGYPGAGGCLYGSGRAFLTDQRLLCVSEMAPLALHQGTPTGIDLPLLQISKEKFHSPILSSRYVSGTVQPTVGGGLVGPGEWKITFFHGGADEFFAALKSVLDEARRDPSAFVQRINYAAANAAAAALDSSNLRRDTPRLDGDADVDAEPRAFIDPENPEEIYLEVKEEKQ
eukprot:TRINITY_DN1155_c0_g1_i4.p1 TRINITY_DN1155_c0_g1~~TRINITY_DN1155_c0_g1_i4.p1  ORF type:complete len:206 (-),score=44.19 TRINITY_DN1155_c0_g1_i4:223-840(-)